MYKNAKIPNKLLPDLFQLKFYKKDTLKTFPNIFKKMLYFLKKIYIITQDT